MSTSTTDQDLSHYRDCDRRRNSEESDRSNRSRGSHDSHHTVPYQFGTHPEIKWIIKFNKSTNFMDAQEFYKQHTRTSADSIFYTRGDFITATVYTNEDLMPYRSDPLILSITPERLVDHFTNEAEHGELPNVEQIREDNEREREGREGEENRRGSVEHPPAEEQHIYPPHPQ